MDWLRAALLVVFALVAVGGIWEAWRLENNAFWSSALLNAANIFIDCIIVTLVVERVISSNERRKWRFSQKLISQALASLYLDVMRLLYVSRLPEDHIDRPGEREFLSIAELHIAAVRSYVEGFSPYLSEDVHREVRRIEAVLCFLHRHFKDLAISTKEGFRLDANVTFEQLRITCGDAALFARRFDGLETKRAAEDVSRALTSAEGADRPSAPIDGPDGFFRIRWLLQSAVLRVYREKAKQESILPSGIRYDIEGELALRYLLLDERIFAKVPLLHFSAKGPSW
ncbi:hypothetical protein A1D31_25655 [Bradyrhizobium liaoningense]|nr:hypothetical protein A1D31_25655 [Bradyrhizobium liaoningense]